MAGLAAAWGGLLLFDPVIFTLTLIKAIAIWKLGTRKLFHVLVRDGEFFSIHFSFKRRTSVLGFYSHAVKFDLACLCYFLFWSFFVFASNQCILLTKQ